MDDHDRLRFVHDLFEFNDADFSSSNCFYFRDHVIAKHEFGEQCHSGRSKKTPRRLLVKIHAFCLMPNHYHLLLSPQADNGMTLFVKKLNMGYALYFNQKHERKGTLFDGRYKSVPVSKEAHFIHLPYYIHLNPLDLSFREWRQRELSSPRKAMDFLERYRWSSHLDYLGIKNFPSVTQRDFLMEFFGGPSGYRASLKTWLDDLDLDNVQGLTLE